MKRRKYFQLDDIQRNQIALKLLNLRKLFFVSLIALMLFGFVGCRQAENTSVASLSLNKTEVTLNIEDTTILKATVNPSNAVNQDITWTSADAGVATVSDMGEIKAISKGTTTITVTTKDGNKKAICKVIVTDPNDVSLKVLNINRENLLDKLDTTSPTWKAEITLDKNIEKTNIVVQGNNPKTNIVGNLVKYSGHSKYLTFTTAMSDITLDEGANTISLTIMSENLQKQASIVITVIRGSIPPIANDVKLTALSLDYGNGSSDDLIGSIEDELIIAPTKITADITGNVILKFKKSSGTNVDIHINNENLSTGTSIAESVNITIPVDKFSDENNFITIVLKSISHKYVYKIQVNKEVTTTP